MTPESQLEQGLPAAVDAERSILGAVLLDNHLYAEAAARICSDAFTLAPHRRIFRRMGELIENDTAVDLITLRDILSKYREMESVGGIAYLASLTENMPRRVSIEGYVNIVAEKQAQRDVIRICSEAIASAAEGGSKAYELVERLAIRVAKVGVQANGIWQKRDERKVLSGGMDFLGAAPAGVDWAVEGIIQRGGNGLIVGDPGAAKSMLALDLALHLITGTSWMGCAVPKPMRVALVSREDHPALTQQRGMELVRGANDEMKELFDGIDLNDRLAFSTASEMQTFSLSVATDASEMIEGLKAFGAEFVIFDVFRRLWDGREEDNQEVAAVLSVLTRIQREVGCSVVLVHHLNKGGQGTVFQRIRGASAIYGWREWAMGITVENPGDPPSQRVRKVEFETKAAQAMEPKYFRLASGPGSVALVEVGPPEENDRTFKSVADARRAKRDEGALYGATNWQDKG